MFMLVFFFFFQAEDGIRDYKVTGVQTCALPISTSCAPTNCRTMAPTRWKPTSVSASNPTCGATNSRPPFCGTSGCGRSACYRTTPRKSRPWRTRALKSPKGYPAWPRSSIRAKPICAPRKKRWATCWTTFSRLPPVAYAIISREGATCPCGRGEIGRRARLRIWSTRVGGGSSPLGRTNPIPRPTAQRSLPGGRPLLLQLLDLFLVRLEAWAAHQAISEVLALLHARLVKGVDVQQFPHEGGLELHHLQERAQVLLVQAVESHRAVWTAVHGEGSRRRALLGVDQLRQGLVHQIVDRFQSERAGGNRIGRPEFLHLPEGEHLVVGAFDVQLHLGVLIGGSQRRHRRLSHVHHRARAIALLAQRFGPELAEPEGGSPELVGVRERHLNGLFLTDPDEPVPEGGPQGDVFFEIGLPRAVRHFGGAAGQFADIDPDERCGQQSHRRKHAETPAHILGDAKRFVALSVGELAKRALILAFVWDFLVFAQGRHRDDAAGGLVPERPLQPVADDQKRRHGFRGGARFRDRHDQRLVSIHGRQRRSRERGVDVIENHQPRVLRREGALHRVGTADAAIERPRAQRAAADAHHANRVVFEVDGIGILVNGVDHLLLEREVWKAVEALFTFFPK